MRILGLGNQRNAKLDEERVKEMIAEAQKQSEESQVDQLISDLKEENQKPKEQPAQFKKAPPVVREWTKMIETKDEEDNAFMARLHHIKLQENFAGSVLSGEKSFELRRNDRGYQRGDLIQFEVVNFAGNPIPYHEIEEKTYQITYVISGWGREEGFVALAIKEVKYDEDVQ